MVTGGVFGLVGALLVLPAVILMMPLVSSGNEAYKEDSSLIVNAYATFAAVISFPAVLAGSLSYFLAKTSVWAMTDPPSMMYKGILHELIHALGGNPMLIVDEL